MKVNYSVTLEPQDIVDAINTYLKTNGVEAQIDVEQLNDGLNEDMTLDIETSGTLPSKAPVKRRRRATKVEPDELHDKSQATEASQAEESKLKPKQVVDELSKDGSKLRDQTIIEEANELNKERLIAEAKPEVVEKVKAVDINDVDEDNGLVEGEAESDEPVKHTAEEIVTNAKNSSIPLAKQGIFKKRPKKV